MRAGPAAVDCNEKPHCQTAKPEKFERMTDDQPDPASAPDDEAMERRRGFDRSLLEFLVCPIRKTTLIYDAERQELLSPAADLAYPIHDGVPLLTEECARPLTDQDRLRQIGRAHV